MLTKEDFLKSAHAEIDNFGKVAALYRAGDPRIHEHLGAIAQMLAMLSAQIEAAYTEPFEKVRDATVLADAAMRGIIRKASPARIRIKAINKSDHRLNLDEGRIILDTNGLPWRIETSLSLLAQSEGVIEATQEHESVIAHTVKDPRPFYEIKIPESDDGSFLSSIALRDQNGWFEYRNQYLNVAAGEKVWGCRRLTLMLGYENASISL